jgi:protein phosphatase
MEASDVGRRVSGESPQEEAPVPAAENRSPSLQWQHDELLRAEDVLGRRHIATRLKSSVTIPAENAAAALEVMSRFAVEPRWLIYLPPTMSPCETAKDGEALERPEEAFAYYRSQGVEQVVCQRKHMGSRAVVVVCRDREAARRRFGAEDVGQCYTRTGRQFFDDPALQHGLLTEAAETLTRAGFWEEFATDWACFDGELMPWNAKAQGLLREQYAPVGTAARTALAQALDTVEQAVGRGLDLKALRDSLRRRQEDVADYAAAYARYCWDVNGLADIRLAPFHLLATEGRTYFDRDHAWHVSTLARLAEHSDLFLATDTRPVNTQDETSQAEGAAWWQELTASGGEGMVVKPLDFLARGPKGLIQPAVKVRGREYLRIIYGPAYTEPENLQRLRARSLGAKRSLALREFALGAEGLERFVRKEPLRRVHECVFGVLALESEPVDPRL